MFKVQRSVLVFTIFSALVAYGAGAPVFSSTAAARTATRSAARLDLHGSKAPITAQGVAQAPTIWYVNVVTGNDSNNGMSANTPFKYITKAMSVALSGDTINVAPGTYVWALPPC